MNRLEYSVMPAAVFLLSVLPALPWRLHGETRAPQTITWTTPATNDVLRLGQSYPLQATASSGLPVSFRVERGPAVIQDGMVRADAVGSVVIVAEQAGAPEFAAAVPVSRLFNQSAVLIRQLDALPNYVCPRALRLHRNIAYAGDCAGSLLVVDITDPAAPSLLSWTRVGGEWFELDYDAERELVFTAGAAAGCQVFDLHDPASPQRVGSVIPAGSLTRVAVSGQHAYAPLTQGGIVVIDTADPKNPFVVETHPFEQAVQDIRIVGRYAYLAANGLAVMDLLTPTEPAVVGRYDSPAPYLTVCVDGNRAYCATALTNVAILDVANPAQPVLLGLIQAQDRVTAVSARGPRVFFADTMAFRVVDAGDPRKPVSMGSTAGWMAAADAIAVKDDTVWQVRIGGGLRAVQVREGISQTVQFNPPALVPEATRTLSLEATASSGTPATFEVVSGPATVTGNQLIITGPGVIKVLATQAGSEQFLPGTVEKTITVADPPVITLQPQPTNVAPGTRVTLSVSATGTLPLSFKWYSNGSSVSGMTTNPYSSFVNVSYPAIYSVVVANIAGQVESWAVTLATNLPGNGFIFRPRGGITGFPVGAGSGAPIRMQVRENFLYLVDGWGTNLYVVDIANPDAPRIVSTLPVAPAGYYGPFGVALIDDYALLADRNRGLLIVDIADPAAPVEVRALKLPGWTASSIVLRDRRAYIGNEDGGLVVFDVDDPANPVLIGQWKGRARANGVALDGDRAYLADWASGVEIVDITNPAAPLGLGAYPAEGVTYGGTAFDVLPHGDRLYVADTTRGLVTLDVSTPAAPTQVAVSTIGAVWGLQRIDRYLFAASESTGWRLMLYDVGSSSAPVSIGRYHRVLQRTGLLDVRLRGNRALLGGYNFSLVDVEFPPLAPEITDPPESRRVIAGAKLVLEVAAAGSEPFTYQWLRDGKEILGATQSQLTWTSIQMADAGDYSAVVANSLGRVVSAVAHIDVRAPWINVSSVRKESPDRVRFGVRAAPGSRFAVLQSEDLIHWSDLQVLTAIGRETTVVDESLGANARFYHIQTR